MDVHPPEPAPHQGMCFDEGEQFVLIHDRGLREISKQPEDLAPATQRAAGEFAHNERRQSTDSSRRSPGSC